MVKQLLALCLLAASCFGQAYTYRDPVFVGSIKSNYKLPNGVVGYWPLHGTAMNAATNGDNGTLAGGAIFVPDGYPYAYSVMLPEGTSLVTIGPSAALNLYGANQKFSIAFWANHTNTGYGQYEGAVQTAGYGATSFIARNPNGSPKFNTGGNTCTDDGPSWKIPTNAWVHYVWTYDKTNKVLYTNGVFVMKAPCNSQALAGTTNVQTWIGNNYDSVALTNRNFRGLIQEVVISKMAWTSNDVSYLYHTFYGQP